MYYSVVLLFVNPLVLFFGDFSQIFSQKVKILAKYASIGVKW